MAEFMRLISSVIDLWKEKIQNAFFFFFFFNRVKKSIQSLLMALEIPQDPQSCQT